MCASPLSPQHAQPDWMGGGLVSRQMMHASPSPPFLKMCPETALFGDCLALCGASSVACARHTFVNVVFAAGGASRCKEIPHGSTRSAPAVM